MSSKRKCWEYSLQIKGVIGRDRKAKTYHLTLVETDTTDKIKPEDLLDLITRKCVEVKYRFGHLALVEYPVLIEDMISHSGKASRSRQIEITKGVVVWKVVGLNLPSQ